MRQYPMTLSAGVKLVTGLVVLLLCATPVVVWSLSPGILIGGPRGPAGPVVQGAARWGTLLAPLIALACWAFSPRGIEIEGVSVLPSGSLRGAVRTFGVGGLFGHYGWFYRKGAFRLYATRTDRLVEVVIEGRRIVVSPDEPQRFVDGLLASAPRARLRQPGAAGAASATRTS